MSTACGNLYRAQSGFAYGDRTSSPDLPIRSSRRPSANDEAQKHRRMAVVFLFGDDSIYTLDVVERSSWVEAPAGPHRRWRAYLRQSCGGNCRRHCEQQSQIIRSNLFSLLADNGRPVSSKRLDRRRAGHNSYPIGRQAHLIRRRMGALFQKLEASEGNLWGKLVTPS
jgi:hypothetical protein